MKRIFVVKQGYYTDILIKGLTESIATIFSLITFGIISRGLALGAYTVLNQTLNATLLLAPILALRLYTAFCVFFPGNDKAHISTVYKTSLLITAMLSGLIGIVMNIFRSEFSFLLFGTNEYAVIVPFLSIYMILFSLNEITLGFFRAVKMIRTGCIFLLIRNIILMAMFAYSYFSAHITLTHSFVIYIAVEVILLMASLLVFIRNYHEKNSSMGLSVMRPYFHYCLPLIPYTILGWVNTYLSRFVITHLDGLDSSAEYIFNSSLIMKMTMLTGVIGYVLFPYVAKSWNDGNMLMVQTYVIRSYYLYLWIAIPISVAIFITAPSIVLILGGGNYTENLLILAILCIANLFAGTYSILSYIIDMTRRTYIYVILLLGSSTVNILFCFLLIPRWSVVGGCIALLASNIVQVISIVIYIKMYTAIKIKLHISVIFVIAIATIGAIYVIDACYHATTINNFILSILSGIVAYLMITMLISFLFYKLKGKQIYE